MANNSSSNPYLLPIKDTITSAWKKVDGAKGTFWAAFGIVFAISIVGGALTGMLEKGSFIYVAISFVVTLVQLLLQVGLMYIGIQRAKDLPITYKQVFYGFEVNVALSVFGLYILQFLFFLIPGLIVGVVAPMLVTTGSVGATFGIACAVIAFVAMIFLGVRLMLAVMFILDKGMGPINAIVTSFNATRSNFWNLVGLFVALFLIIVVSAIPLGIGLIWTLPLTMIVYGLMYNRLSANA